MLGARRRQSGCSGGLRLSVVFLFLELWDGRLSPGVGKAVENSLSFHAGSAGEALHSFVPSARAVERGR